MHDGEGSAAQTHRGRSADAHEGDVADDVAVEGRAEAHGNDAVHALRTGHRDDVAVADRGERGEGPVQRRRVLRGPMLQAGARCTAHTTLRASGPTRTPFFSTRAPARGHETGGAAYTGAHTAQAQQQASPQQASRRATHAAHATQAACSEPKTKTGRVHEAVVVDPGADVGVPLRGCGHGEEAGIEVSEHEHEDEQPQRPHDLPRDEEVHLQRADQPCERTRPPHPHHRPPAACSAILISILMTIAAFSDA